MTHRKSTRILMWCAYAAIIVGMCGEPAHAQTILKVPFGSATFAWTAPAPSANKSPADKHTIVCGSISVDVPMPATSIAVRDVVQATGVYSCSLFASNAFGRQVEPNVPFPQFEAGLEPASPINPRLEVAP